MVHACSLPSFTVCPFTQELTNLTKLNLYGCKRLSDQGLSCLTILPLKALSLGQTRIRKEGLKQVASLTQLTELHLVKEEVGLDGLVQLSALTGLHTLSLRDLKLTNPVVAVSMGVQAVLGYHYSADRGSMLKQ